MAFKEPKMEEFVNFKFFLAASYLYQTEKRILSENSFSQLNYYIRVWITFLADAYHELRTGEQEVFSDMEPDRIINYFLQHHSELMAIELLTLTELNGEQWYEGLDDASCAQYVRIKLEKARAIMHELMGIA
ncbi:MAG: hypothetical protein R8M38_07175 [Mariprofundaceae bacterium]